jgi:hypothetical protein
MDVTVRLSVVCHTGDSFFEGAQRWNIEQK